MTEKVYLTRRNLLTLLSKLERKGKGDETACTIVKRDNEHEKYPQTMEKLAVVAVEYGGTFTGARLCLSREFLKTQLANLDRRKAGEDAPCVVMVQEAHARKKPKAIEVTALEDEEYYLGRRLPGEVFPLDEPGARGTAATFDFLD